jgi:hypothetical protein
MRARRDCDTEQNLVSCYDESRADAVTMCHLATVALIDTVNIRRFPFATKRRRLFAMPDFEIGGWLTRDRTSATFGTPTPFLRHRLLYRIRQPELCFSFNIRDMP